MKRLLLLFSLLVFLLSCGEKKPEIPAVSADDIALNNRGVGLMGQFQYAAARDIFEQLHQKHPNHAQLATNLAIATLNRQNPGDEKTALEILGKVLEREPSHQAAQYCSGLLHLYLSNADAAFTHFSAVENDAYATYHLGQILADRNQVEDSLAKFEKALSMDAYLRSAYYGAFRAYQQSGDRERSAELLEGFQKLNNNPRAHLFEIKYTRMGPLAEVKTLGHTAQEAPLSGEVFGTPVPLGSAEAAWATIGATSPGLTAVDFNGDGHLDLFHNAGFSENGSLKNVVWLNDGQKGFTPLTDHPLGDGAALNAVLWGDFDNDGLVDAYFCRNGTNQLFRQIEKGQWQDVTQSTGTAGGEFNTVAGAFFDADHDGDLDIFLINANGANELLNNNRDGSFQAIAAEQGLDGGNRASKNLVVGDFDGDRDADILVIHQEPPHQVFLNDRLWSYRQSDIYAELESLSLDAAFLADLDADGAFDFISVEPNGQVKSWQKNAQGITATLLHNLAQPSNGAIRTYALADLEGDGKGELLYTSEDSWFYVNLDPQGKSSAETEGPGGAAAGLLPVALDAGKGYSIAMLNPGNQLALLPPGPGRHAFLTVTLGGKEDTGQAMRSNASGIGTELAARSGTHWAIAHHYPSMSVPGQSAQPLAMGLGGATQVDFLAIEWSDGVYQTELGLATSNLHALTETQRQLSSCPVIFTWDGSEHRFVSDVLGVAGIGFAVGKGVYSEPRPWENFLMPSGLAKPKDGHFQLKITEPMEEAAYIDTARLVQYALPEGWDMVIDERMWTSGPQPTGLPIYFRRELLPVMATDQSGANRSQELAKQDFEAAPIGTKDSRFLGRLANPLQLTLEFGQIINGKGEKPVLVADGWVEYPYSQTMFAAWQANASYDPPTLEARDESGAWHLVYAKFGYPAGMPRRMALPLEALPQDTVALRLTSNLEIYWDRIAIAFEEPCPEAKVERLTLTSASLGQTGFAKRTNGPQMLPQYDYSQRVPLWDTRYMDGYYTALGPVLPLVERADDALAIIGPGEELHLEFKTGDLQSHPNSRLVLEIQGWCKDMDLYTKDGETLGPLPTTGHPEERREALHATFNRRFQSGR